MSPLWRDEIGLYVSPTVIIVNRMRRGLRPVCEAHESVDLVPVAGGGFEVPLQALTGLLEDVRWRNANVRIVVADSWVRFALVPWSAGLTSDERLTHSWHVMEQAFGEMRNDWRLAVGNTGAGWAQLACAMPAALNDGLLQVAAQAGLRVLSLQPQLVVAFNCARDRIPPASGWFVTMNAGSLAAAQFGPHGWEQVRSVRIGSDWEAELRRLRRFGQLTARGAEDARVFVDAPLWVQHLAKMDVEGLEMLPPPAGQARATLQSLVTLKGVHP